MHIGILDLGINNLSSVYRSFSRMTTSHDTITVISDGLDISSPDLLVLPGLGKFSSGINALKLNHMIDFLHRMNREKKKIVGICLGMQLLGSASNESPNAIGLDIIPGQVMKLPTSDIQRVPNIGWSGVGKPSDSNPFKSLETPGDFYFVHSYHLVPKDRNSVLTKTIFGEGSFVSSVLTDNVVGFQFHPEKSGKKGVQLINEIISWGRN
jgi:imidazole glycerol phosphate synthase glutamine amidotransferase subunit